LAFAAAVSVEELAQALVVHHDHVAAGVAERLDGAPPVGDDRERADHQHRLRRRHRADRLPGADRLAEAHVVGQQEAPRPDAAARRMASMPSTWCGRGVSVASGGRGAGFSRFRRRSTRCSSE
jgi:hypothetical protein